MKLAVIFGGKSTEHDVSIVSGTSVIANLNQEKYQIYPIYIDKFGTFYAYPYNKRILSLGETPQNLKRIDNILAYLKNIDIVFPVLHGKYGEDGTIQGMLDLIDKKYVGCHTLSSSICMDKVYTKIILNSAGIKQADYIVVKQYQNEYKILDNSFNESIHNSISLINFVNNKFTYPIFVKPSKSGSSIGVTKVNIEDELINAIEEAFKYDDKVLVEECIMGREVECALLGNDELIASPIGEIKTNTSFYSYDSKYKSETEQTLIPNDISFDITNKIKKIAKKAFQVCDCKGLARIDFFIKDDNEIILNEINTMPGFTSISMYPKLMQEYGYDYKTLLDELVELAKNS